MYIPYSELTPNARVWIYQSDRALNTEEKLDIESQLQHLCNKWNAHGTPLHCSYQVHDYFLCLFVDEAAHGASGCSIDSSVAVIKSIGSQYQIDFFNRMNIVFEQENKTELLPLSKFKKVLSSKMLVYNNLVGTKKDYESQWKISIQQSWLAKFLA